MANKVIGTCPICGDELRVTKLSCRSCSTEITGDFELSRLHYLQKEELHFVEVFIKNRGNIKEIEKELNISYPTVKKNLNEVIEKLGFETRDIDDETEDDDILEKIKKGEITAKEAVKLIKRK